jgi:hypothetical protein
MRTTDEILDSIDNRLREVKEEIRTLNAARAALHGRERPTARRPRRTVTTRAAPPQTNGAVATARAEGPVEVGAETSSGAPSPSPRESRAAAPRRRRRRAVRAVDVVPAGTLEQLLSENGGLTTSALADEANGNRDQVLRSLRELEAAGRVRRTGQRRATRWHAITDDDRIRERAAELAARRKRVG